MARKATLIGASGLIGRTLLDLLLNDGYFEEVHIMVRKTCLLKHPKLTEHIIGDFSDPAAYDTPISGAETVFSTIGTTMKNVKGDLDAYRKVDYDIPVNAAKTAAKFGVFSFVFVSSIGANAADNNNFYLKLKGIVEETISKEIIPQVIIFRPSLLLGHRQEKRFGERIAQVMAPLFSTLLFGKWRAYKPIPSAQVAAAMLTAAKAQKKGIFIYTYDDIKKLAPAST
ncbi:NAD(P)H-binding protein [Flavihumibacter fluvii]|uniref:NAD(P)H-binding protein n=1 Tax=Flavihumibacter fluvii TaxID=2838157 RepID=UPI001BDE837C|nr:NAD(P)H-binding protein [Flavihumibacter fluvii]ULQ53809.1 NAD(P)H-binding protein [Flavihumibacter fluvii]